MYNVYMLHIQIRLFRKNIQLSITLQHGQLDVMDDCIKMFFLKTPPSNQFLCRAYLCQAQLNAPTSSKNPVRTIIVIVKTVECHLMHLKPTK